MANGMGSLYIGSSGLRTSQNALNTTANNLANVDTTGYVRQQVIQADRHYNTFDKNAAISNQQSGLGVSIADVIHSRDIFLCTRGTVLTDRPSCLQERYREISGKAGYQFSFLRRSIRPAPRAHTSIPLTHSIS